MFSHFIKISDRLKLLTKMLPLILKCIFIDNHSHIYIFIIFKGLKKQRFWIILFSDLHNELSSWICDCQIDFITFLLVFCYSSYNHYIGNLKPIYFYSVSIHLSINQHFYCNWYHGLGFLFKLVLRLLLVHILVLLLTYFFFIWTLIVKSSFSLIIHFLLCFA